MKPSRMHPRAAASLSIVHGVQAHVAAFSTCPHAVRIEVRHTLRYGVEMCAGDIVDTVTGATLATVWRWSDMGARRAAESVAGALSLKLSGGIAA